MEIFSEKYNQAKMNFKSSCELLKHEYSTVADKTINKNPEKEKEIKQYLDSFLNSVDSFISMHCRIREVDPTKRDLILHDSNIEKYNDDIAESGDKLSDMLDQEFFDESINPLEQIIDALRNFETEYEKIKFPREEKWKSFSEWFNRDEADGGPKLYKGGF